ncbi:uncharacterized protein [Setaria viridis]|uniref:uncharacterized protein n=1 Tax=Setaria viridis TaxID=4556 RepID=UPI001493DD9F|nr:uncharacterized protein LOC117844080 [Setaria viridis]
MDPKFNGEWSASKIEMVKSLIASHNPNNNFVDGPNIKHNDIVNDIQACSPGRSSIRQFLLGMCEYGRGKWKDISRDFVTTNTPVKVSSHAQKYSINDVSLYDAEPWAQNISSNWEALAFAGGAYNPNYYGSGS